MAKYLTIVSVCVTSKKSMKQKTGDNPAKENGRQYAGNNQFWGQQFLR